MPNIAARTPIDQARAKLETLVEGIAVEVERAYRCSNIGEDEGLNASRAALLSPAVVAAFAAMVEERQRLVNANFRRHLRVDGLLRDKAAYAAKLEAAEAAVAELKVQCSLFASFIGFMDAGREVDGDERLKDDQVVLNYSGPGCGIVITVGDFRKLSAYQSALDAAPPTSLDAKVME